MNAWTVTTGIAYYFAVLTCIQWGIAQFKAYDDTDRGTTRSGMTILTDNRTGCQYLGYQLGGLTPRVNKDGKQFCNDGVVP